MVRQPVIRQRTDNETIETWKRIDVYSPVFPRTCDIPLDVARTRSTRALELCWLTVRFRIGVNRVMLAYPLSYREQVESTGSGRNKR